MPNQDIIDGLRDFARLVEAPDGELEQTEQLIAVCELRLGQLTSEFDHTEALIEQLRQHATNLRLVQRALARHAPPRPDALNQRRPATAE